jgi:UDP-2,3-diacylglucosamine hydrolase
VSTLFVSDLHLDAAFPDAGDQFCEFLRNDARASEALYILGDLFEVWIGDDVDDPEYVRVQKALADLTGAGTACFLMHGNRDFLLGERFAAGAGCELLPDPQVIDLYGDPVLVTHGDLLCTDDRSYQQLRAVVRDAGWQRRFLRLPVPARRALASAARAGSQQHMERLQPQIMDVRQEAVDAAMRACGVHTLIHGHTHRPAIHEFSLQGQPARRIVLGAWYEQGSCLRCEPGGSYELLTLARGGPE